jgi:gallate dioxygenase
MARILGGIGTSHTPTIGFALDARKHDDPVWAPIFKGYEPVQQWLADRQPDVLFFIYNDHVTSFFFDHYSAFTLGIGEKFPVADEGGGARDLPPAIGHPALARHIGQALMADEFDMSFFQDKPLDHGLFSPLSMLARQKAGGGWPTPIIPLVVGVLQFPIPSEQDAIFQLCRRVLTEVYSMNRGDHIDFHFLRKSDVGS